jgi:hypothetical protein
MAYTITAVSDQVRQWNSTKGGPMNSYRVHLKAPDGEVVQNVELSQKNTSPIPTVGQQLEGNVDQGQYGLKFRKAFGGPAGGGGGGGYKGKTPSEQASIAASVALDKALIAVEQAATLGVVKVGSAEEHAAAIDRYFAHFFKLIDAKGKAAEAA